MFLPIFYFGFVNWCWINFFCRDNLQLLRQRYYYATWKADGTRYMMLITGDGCYLIDRKFLFRRINMRFPCRYSNGVYMFILFTYVSKWVLYVWISGRLKASSISVYIIYCANVDVLKSQNLEGYTGKESPLHITWWGDDYWHRSTHPEAREKIPHLWFDCNQSSLFDRGTHCLTNVASKCYWDLCWCIAHFLGRLLTWPFWSNACSFHSMKGGNCWRKKLLNLATWNVRAFPRA